jgi:hypothetical protein
MEFAEYNLEATLIYNFEFLIMNFELHYLEGRYNEGITGIDSVDNSFVPVLAGGGACIAGLAGYLATVDSIPHFSDGPQCAPGAVQKHPIPPGTYFGIPNVK